MIDFAFQNVCIGDVIGVIILMVGKPGARSRAKKALELFRRESSNRNEGLLWPDSTAVGEIVKNK